MQHSRDRILTSHAGSLPRPDALIAANQARQSGGDVDEARFQAQLQCRRGGCGAPPAGTRHRHSRRRRIRQGDGASRQLRRVVELFVPASRRPRSDRARAVRHARPPCAARRGGADQLRRPSRPAALRGRLCRSGIRHHHGTARQDVADLHRPAHLHRPRRDRARHRQLQGGPRRVRHRGRLHDLDRAGQRLAHQQRVLQDRGRVHVRLRRRRCARNTRRSSMRD